MKKRIAIGSLLAFFILMTLPAVSAVKFNAVVEENKVQLLNEIKSAELIAFRKKIQEIHGQLLDKYSNEQLIQFRLRHILGYLITVFIIIPLNILEVLSYNLPFGILENILYAIEIIFYEIIDNFGWGIKETLRHVTPQTKVGCLMSSLMI